MIDWHSHLLPGIDDGSKNTAESIGLLNALSGQGINTVVATPHFYANDEDVDGFITRRSASFDELRGCLMPHHPDIVLGAEVRYYSGIGRMADLKRLCIGGSNLLLLEMPFAKWTEYTVRELTEMAGSGGITLVLAHVERYLRWQSDDVLRRLLDSGVLMQANAGFFTGLLTRGRALDMLQSGGIQLIGSDCHNLTSRPPNIDRAYALIEKKLGGDFISQMHEYGQTLLVQNSKK